MREGLAEMERLLDLVVRSISHARDNLTVVYENKRPAMDQLKSAQDTINLAIKVLTEL